jgi:hypothetical protein
VIKLSLLLVCFKKFSVLIFTDFDFRTEFKCSIYKKNSFGLDQSLQITEMEVKICMTVNTIEFAAISVGPKFHIGF